MRNFAIYLAFGVGAFIVGLVYDGATKVNAAAPASLAITTTSQTGEVSASFTAAIAASGDVKPYQFNAAGLPNTIATVSTTGVSTAMPAAAGTHRALAVDRNTCLLYETFNTHRCSGKGASDSETIWSPTQFGHHTPPWPSADAATPAGDVPTITCFTASATSVKPGTPSTLAWETSDESYLFIDKLGGARGKSATVKPTATTTYTLNATNEFGRSTKKVAATAQ